MLSDRLSRKLSDAAGPGIDEQILSDIQSELDRIIATARDIMG
jgi:hypothetical protein